MRKETPLGYLILLLVKLLNLLDNAIRPMPRRIAIGSLKTFSSKS